MKIVVIDRVTVTVLEAPASGVVSGGPMVGISMAALMRRAQTHTVSGTARLCRNGNPWIFKASEAFSAGLR